MVESPLTEEQDVCKPEFISYSHLDVFFGVMLQVFL